MEFPQEALLIIPLLIIAVVCSWLEKKTRKKDTDLAFMDVDDLHHQEWDGEPGDELMAWYRVRKRVFTHTSMRRSKRQALMDAVEIRITQCRARNQSFRTTGLYNGHVTTISTQN